MKSPARKDPRANLYIRALLTRPFEKTRIKRIYTRSPAKTRIKGSTQKAPKRRAPQAETQTGPRGRKEGTPQQRFRTPQPLFRTHVNSPWGGMLETSFSLCAERVVVVGVVWRVAGEASGLGFSGEAGSGEVGVAEPKRRSVSRCRIVAVVVLSWVCW